MFEKKRYIDVLTTTKGPIMHYMAGNKRKKWMEKVKYYQQIQEKCVISPSLQLAIHQRIYSTPIVSSKTCSPGTGKSSGRSGLFQAASCVQFDEDGAWRWIQ